MSNNDPLVILRSAIAAKVKPQLITVDSVKTDDIVTANALRFPPIPGIAKADVVVLLDSPTRFQVNDISDSGSNKKFIDTRTVYNCWITKDLSVTDYITISDERGILNLKFLERTDLITWLEGASMESSNIVPAAVVPLTAKPSSVASTAITSRVSGTGPSALPSSGRKVTKREVDPDLQKIYNQERSLIDHNRALRGNKQIDFSSVSAECRQRILSNYRNGAVGGVSSNASANGSAVTAASTAAAARRSGSKESASLSGGITGGKIPLPSSGKNHDPIILISPSASSLLNMSNVKEFLETGRFDPVTVSSGAANLLRVSRNSPKLGQTRFVVVNSVEKFKPEYWDRVVAVFVTGQSWQFRTYQWSDPNVLFQKVLGFAITYKGDPTPPTLTQWNVAVESLERNERFRDREVSERIWDKIEQSMIARGWPAKKK